MNKLLTKIVGAALGLTMAIGVGVAVASNSKEATPVHATETSYTITFKTGSGDGTKGSTSTAMSSYTSSSYVTGNATTATNAYYAGSSGLKLGTSSASGSLAFGLATSGQVTATKVKVNAKRYNSSKAATIKLGNLATQGLTSSFADYEFALTGALTSISITTSKYAWVASVSVYYNASDVLVTGVSVTPASVTLGVGATQQLTPTVSPSNATNKNVSYSSSASSVASVSAGGLITANAAGNATITVTTQDGSKTATCAVTVTAPIAVTGVSLNKPSTTIEAGSTETLTATVAPANASNKSVTWDTSDSNVATVSGGVVTAKGAGTATITATTVDGGFTASCSVKVSAPQSVTFTAGTDVGTTTSNNSPDSVTKSGITMNCTDAAFLTTEYRYYSGSTLTFTSSVGKMAKIEFTGDSSKKMGNISLSSGGGEVTKSGNDATWTAASGGTNEVVFTFSAQNRATEVKITLASNDPLVELAASSATSVTMMKGGSDTTVKVHVANITTKNWAFTFDEGGNTGLTTSSYIDVSAGAAVSDVHTLTITTKAVGSTVLHIAVSGTACATTIPVTVAAKPAVGTLVAKHNSKVVSSAVECITGSHVAFTFEAEDTDGNPYSVNAAALELTITSGSSYGTAYGTTGINGVKQGTVVARFALKVREEVYVDVTVNVVDDYIETVGTPTFAPDLTDTQGQSPTVSVFTSRPGTLHSGNSTTVPFENYKFSYDQTYASAQYGSVFTYDFSHGTTVDPIDPTHKSQTIYVFCDIDEAAHGSYTITVEQFNDPLTAITFTNVTSNAVDVVRGSTFQLEWEYTPTNPTDGKEVEFIIGDNSDGIDITVSELGLISIGASSDLGDALVIIQSTHDDSIQDYVVVSAVLGTMKYTVSEAESWTKVTNDSTLTAGDVIIVASDTKGKVLGDFTGSNKYANEGSATFSDGSASEISGALEFTLETGSSSGTWKLKNGTKYLCGTSSKTTLCLSDTATDVTITISSGNATIGFGSSCRILHNVSSTRFSNYTSDTSSTMLLPQIYKKSGGDVEMDVTETLFNGVHNNFGTGKTYEWDASCSNFDDEAWFNACDALMSITGYSNYKLNRAVGNMAGNEIEVFLAKYDAIIGKFGTTHDYLDRFAQGGINYGARIVNPINVLSNNGSTIAIIVVVSVISATAIGGYFFLRKRKEN